MRKTMLGLVSQFTPSLFLDFTKGVVPSAVTCSRNSIATRINGSGVMETVAANVPRIDYDPVTMACRGLLIEESRTNYILNSITPGNWSVAGATVRTPNATTAPDGSLVPSFTNTAGQYSGVNMSKPAGFVLANSTSYTISTLYKCLAASNPANKRFFWEVNFGSTNNLGNAGFNIATLTTTKSAAITSATIEDWGGGWYRAVMTFTTDAAGTPAISGAYIAGYASSTDTCTLAFFGAQLEPGAFATSIIPTTTAAVTRGADICTLNAGAWLNQNAGTFLVETYHASAATVAGGARILAIGTGPSTMLHFGYNTPATNRTESYNGTAVTGVTGSRTTGTIKHGCAFDANGRSVTREGLAVGTDTNLVASYGAFSSFMLGNRGGGTGAINSHYRKLTYYPRRVPNSLMQALTT
ncbi:phage head spike fiber domain-containing protein [Arsenicibacter rosenii]|uniref:Uncharacterized protein n=1 Tax=Arsenicibacter rosenii TaxID=1750698 RepID=A0A1S2V9Y6_9BACT|nr:hypothetical protein [Arsenicibacter rosenii]OIN55523.1 hypothetical protein BLX24_29765 [Arsenicibacter rosenii]